jgi:hypothetical protein
VLFKYVIVRTYEKSTHITATGDLAPSPGIILHQMHNGERTTSGFVYAIEGVSGHIKIGTSLNVQNRLNELQVGSPVRLTLLATCAGGRQMEESLHRQFAAFRLSGEWFALPEVQRWELIARMGGDPWKHQVPNSKPRKKFYKRTRSRKWS